MFKKKVVGVFFINNFFVFECEIKFVYVKIIN